jgi:hypothetical protein
MTAEVDEELAPLILALWKRNIHTRNSCQENFPGIAWIEFPTTFDAKDFLDLVAVYPKEEIRVANAQLPVQYVPFCEALYWRITNCGSVGDWQYDVHPHNWNVEEAIVNDEVVETCVGPSDFDFAVSIRFPRTDLPVVLEQVCRRERPD